MQPIRKQITKLIMYYRGEGTPKQYSHTHKNHNLRSMMQDKNLIMSFNVYLASL